MIDLHLVFFALHEKFDVVHKNAELVLIDYTFEHAALNASAVSFHQLGDLLQPAIVGYVISDQ